MSTHTHTHYTKPLQSPIAAMSLTDCIHNVVCVVNRCMRIVCFIFVSMFKRKQMYLKNYYYNLKIFLPEISLSVNLNPSALNFLILRYGWF